MGVSSRQNDITMVCQGKKPSDFGFGWRFKEDYEKERREKSMELIFLLMSFKSLNFSILNRMEKVDIYLSCKTI